MAPSQQPDLTDAPQTQRRVVKSAIAACGALLQPPEVTQRWQDTLILLADLRYLLAQQVEYRRRPASTPQDLLLLGEILVELINERSPAAQRGNTVDDQIRLLGNVLAHVTQLMESDGHVTDQDGLKALIKLMRDTDDRFATRP